MKDAPMSSQDTQVSWDKIKNAAFIITTEAKAIVDDPNNGLSAAEMQMVREYRRQWVALRDAASDFGGETSFGGC